MKIQKRYIAMLVVSYLSENVSERLSRYCRGNNKYRYLWDSDIIDCVSLNLKKNKSWLEIILGKLDKKDHYDEVYYQSNKFRKFVRRLIRDIYFKKKTNLIEGIFFVFGKIYYDNEKILRQYYDEAFMLDDPNLGFEIVKEKIRCMIIEAGIYSEDLLNDFMNIIDYQDNLEELMCILPIKIREFNLCSHFDDYN